MIAFWILNHEVLKTDLELRMVMEMWLRVIGACDWRSIKVDDISLHCLLLHLLVNYRKAIASLTKLVLQSMDGSDIDPSKAQNLSKKIKNNVQRTVVRVLDMMVNHPET